MRIEYISEGAKQTQLYRRIRREFGQFPEREKKTISETI